MSRCPVCAAELVEDSYIDHDPYVLCEESEVCPHGCYVYEYAYGGTHYAVYGKWVASYSWGSAQDYVKREHVALERSIQSARRRLFE